MRVKLPFAILLALSLATMVSLPIVFYWISSGDYYGRKVETNAPTFTLVDTQNQPHSLQKHLGKYTFLYFGYLRCDDICHNQVGVMFNINNHTPNKDLDFIFITMDPNRDSKEMLNDYFNQFGDNFHALTAQTMQDVQRVASKYKAFFSTDGSTKSNRDYEISHPGTLFLIDPKGMIQVVYQNRFLRYDKIIKDLDTIRQQFTHDSSQNFNVHNKQT